MEALQLFGASMGTSGALQLALTVLGFAGKMEEGSAAKQAADYHAAQLEQKAGQARASAQRAAIEKQRQARLVGSRLQALAGGGGSDVGVVNLAAGIAGEGEYGALTALFEGEDRAAGMEQSASAARYEGSLKKRAATVSAFSGALSGGLTMYDKYWPKAGKSEWGTGSKHGNQDYGKFL